LSLCRYLCVSNPKTRKGEGLGYLSGILHLAPASLSGTNVCSYSTPGCRKGCLNTAGRGQMNCIQKARIRKTKLLFKDRPAFLDQLRKDVEAILRACDRRKMSPVIRLNGTSDLPWLVHELAPKMDVGIQWMDYTKIPKPFERVLPNYHLTFSLSENNLMDAIVCLQRGHNVAVVFDVKRDQPLPKFWGYYNIPVIDGDINDLRFLDPKGVVVGLRAKGKAKKDCRSGFVQSPLVQIGRAA
jgi:hypothetical protein